MGSEEEALFAQIITKNMSQLQVSIIGAGISGLVLGRCLLQRGVQAILFEKARDSPRRNDYGITLHSSIYSPLLKVLELDDKTFRQRVAVDSATTGTGDIGLNDLKERSSFRANRNRLEQLLSEGLDVRWEHEFKSLEQSRPDAKGSKTICFKNGKIHSSSVVVGADGPHSQIRSLIGVDAKLQVLPFATYNGKRRVSAADFETMFVPVMQNRCAIEQRVADALLQLSINSRNDKEVHISYTYSRPARNGDDQLYRPERSKDAAKEMPEALFKELKQVSDDLEEPFKSVFDVVALRKDRLLNWLMRSLHLNTDLLSDSAKAGVVLLGDAVHAEPILGGQG